MNKMKYTIDNAPMRGMQKKMVVYTMGGSFIDGYILGIIEFALVLIVPYMHMNAFWQGLIGSSPLIGVFIGSLFLGVLSDKIGRQKIYTLNFVIVVIGSVMQYFVESPGTLFTLRLVLGIAIGAEYAIGPALIAEFEPARIRGSILANLNVAWTVGYVLAAGIGALLQNLGAESWRLMLASSAVFGAVILIIRIGMPESPRWLVMNGRIDEAQKVVSKYFGEDVSIDNIVQEGETESDKKGYKYLFVDGMWKKTVFCAIAWLSGVIPLFGIFTFLPQVLTAIGVKDEGAGSMLVNIAMLIGAIFAVFIVDRVSRRGLCTIGLLVSAIPLFILGIFTGIHGALIVILFSVFIFFAVIAGALTGFVYPSEIFPTDVRSSGIGLCSAVSRIGSAVGTFLVPVLTESVGIGPVLIGMGAFQILAVVLTLAWAPETRQVNVK